jgi:hypothetical protein
MSTRRPAWKSYNSVESVTEILISGDFDISNAYRAVNIHPDSRSHQELSWDFGKGSVFLHDNRLCMGLSSSPYVFSKISDFIVHCMVRGGLPDCINYLDAFCVVARTREECAKAQRAWVAVLRCLGFYTSFKKLTPPSVSTSFLGI